MEILLVGGACLTAWTSVLVATGGGAELSGRRLGRWLEGGLRRLLRLMRRLAGTPLADAVLRVRWARVRARELTGAFSARGFAVDERSAAVMLAGALTVFSVLVGFAFGSPVAGTAAGAVSVAALYATERAGSAKDAKEVAAAMPGVYRTLSVALGSGQTLAQAVSYVAAHERGKVAEAFTHMSLRLRCGSSTEEAVGELTRELSAPGTELLATALVISHRTGSPLRDLLMRSAALAERQGEFERMLSVKTAQVRLSVRIVCLLPAVMLALLALISPDFQAGLLTPAGITCVALAALLDGAALLIIRHLLSGVQRWM